jgi:hypothetical protein
VTKSRRFASLRGLVTNEPDEKTPLLIGLKAARANFLPGLFIQVAMLGCVVAYYRWEPAREWLDVLARLKAEWGYAFSAVLAAVAGALVPEALKVLVFQRGRVRGENFRNLLFLVPFWAAMGICVDTLYRLQVVWFGSVPTPAVLVKKVCVDQFIYNPLFAAPVSAGIFEWRNRGFRADALRGLFTAKFYAEKVLPLLMATWCVWIPAVAVIYALPPLLQVPLFAFALSFWSLILTYIGSPRARQQGG